MRQPFQYENHKFTLPSTWYDVKLKEFNDAIELTKNDPSNLVKWISIFSGLTIEQVNNIPANKTNLLTICLEFLNEEAVDFEKVANSQPPAQFKVGDKIYNPKIDFSKFTTGQQAAYEVETKNGKVPTDRIARCIAICLYQGKYSDDSINDLAKSVEEMPALTALTLHSFFLGLWLNMLELQKPTAQSPNLTAQQMRRALEKSPKGMGGFIRGILYRMGIKRKKIITLT